MFGLIYKEIVTRKKQLIAMLLILAFFTIMVVYDVLSKDEYIGVMLMLASVCVILVSGGMLEESCFENDETKKWLSFIASSEDGIRKQVGSKYLFNLFVMITIFTYLNLLFQFAEAVTGINGVPFYMALQLMIFIQMIYRAIESPFIVAFGSKYGNTIRMIVMLMIVFVFAVYGLFGDLSIFDSKEELLLKAERFLSDKGSYIILLTPAVSLILYYISFEISCRLYLHGGEYYEK